MKQKTVDEADVVVLSAEEEKRFVQEAMLRSSKTGRRSWGNGYYLRVSGDRDFMESRRIEKTDVGREGRGHVGRW